MVRYRIRLTAILLILSVLFAVSCDNTVHFDGAEVHDASELKEALEKGGKIRLLADIGLDDYIDNVTWVGNLSGSNEPVIIQVYNALNTDGLKLTVQDKNEATIPTTFYGHYSQENLDQPPFKIYYPKKKSV